LYLFAISEKQLKILGLKVLQCSKELKWESRKRRNKKINYKRVGKERSNYTEER
jgi:hypothetical protein